jgi:predicted secreted protein
MAFYRGMDGNVTFGGTAVANLKGWTLTTNAEILDTTKVLDPWKTVKGGVAAWSATATFHLDYGDTTGQKLIVDDLMAATPLTASTAWVFRVNSTTKIFTGNGLISNIRVTQQLGSIVELSVDVTGNGQIVPSWS